MFVGSHERQLDPKGRLALPATYRPHLEPRCYLRLGEEGRCIGIITAEESRLVAARVKADVDAGLRSRDELRALAANMIEVVLDSQGRVTLDERLRRYAGLEPGSRVTVAGAFDSIEIWDTAAFEAMSSAGEAKIAGGLSVVPG
jgi:MraZ protein